MAEASIKKNTVYNIIKSCSTIVFPLITIPYILRVLLPENVGKYNFANSIVNYFALIASLGVTTYAIRECSRVKKNQEELSEVASQIFSINIWTTFISYILLGIILLLCSPLKNYRLLIVVQSTVIIFTTLGADWLNSAMEDFKYITLRTFIAQLVSLVAMFVFVKKPEDYVIYAIICVVSSSGANVLNIWYRRRFCKVKFVAKIKWKKHFPPILLLFVMQLSQIVFSSSDITILGLMCGDYEVGLYSTAVKIYNIVNQVITSILWVVMPRLSLLFFEDNYVEINKLLRKILCFIITLGLPCIVGINMLAEEFVIIVGGTEYIGAIPALHILMIALFFSLIGGGFIGNIIMLPSKREKDYLIACCATSIINIVLNVILIPQFGISGAAITTAFSAFLIFAILFFRIDKKINLGNIKSIISAPIIGSILIIVVTFLIKLLNKGLWVTTILSILSSMIVYSIVQILFRNEIVVSVVNPLYRKICNRRKAK